MRRGPDCGPFVVSGKALPRLANLRIPGELYLLGLDEAFKTAAPNMSPCSDNPAFQHLQSSFRADPYLYGLTTG